MHCLKTINVEREYGTTRLFLLATIIFIFVFCFSYIGLSYQYKGFHNDQHIWIVFLLTPFIYPIHKLLHFISLLKYRKMLLFRFKIRYLFVPVVHIRLQQTVPKWHYLITLLTPFIVLNGIFLGSSFYAPQYAHYFSFFLALHTSICLIDLLYTKHLMLAPRNAIIEETPKGYEILVPLT